jgi:hypothetical protein
MQFTNQVDAHNDLEQYLVKRQQESESSFDLELLCKDNEFTRFWRYTGLPIKASHLTLEPAKLAAQGLINPRDIMRSFKAHRQTEVLRPPPVHIFNDATAAPHHLAPTQAGMTRAEAAVQKHVLRGQKEASCWAKMEMDQVQKLLKASKDRQKQAALVMSGTLPS